MLEVPEQNAANRSSTSSKVLFENDRVRVVELRLEPGKREPMHSHPAHLVYVLSPAKMKMTSSDGKVKEVEVKAGQVIWGEPLSHAGENVGTTELHEVIIDLKEGSI